MHTGYRQKGDNTCSTCPREIDVVDGMTASPSQRTLCSVCFANAARLIGGRDRAGEETLVTGSGAHSGWQIGGMLG